MDESAMDASSLRDVLRSAKAESERMRQVLKGGAGSVPLEDAESEEVDASAPAVRYPVVLHREVEAFAADSEGRQVPIGKVHVEYSVRPSTVLCEETGMWTDL